MATVLREETVHNGSEEMSLDSSDSQLETHPGALSDDTAKDLVQFFKLLADETRLRILVFLKHRGELNVQTLCSLLGQSQPSVSHHLALLRVAGLIEMRRSGKHNFYRTIPRRFGQLVETMFGALPEETSHIRLEDHVLSFTLAEPERE